MKAFVISACLFLALAILVITFAALAGQKIEEMQAHAEEASLCVLSGEEDEAFRLFSLVKKEWNKWHTALLLTVHRNNLKPIENALTDAENAIVLEKNEWFYSVLVRLSHEFSSLAGDVMRPSL